MGNPGVFSPVHRGKFGIQPQAEPEARAARASTLGPSRGRTDEPGRSVVRMGEQSMHSEINAATVQEMTVLAHDSSSRASVPHGRKIHVLRGPNHGAAEAARNVFVLVQATELPEVANFVSLVNRRHQLRALVVRDDKNPYWIPQLFERAGLRTLRNTLVHSDRSVPGRVLRAWAHGEQEEL